MSDEDGANIVWDDVDWSNTHMAVSTGQYHLGRMHTDRGIFVALSVGSDGDDCQIVLLSDDDVDQMMRFLRQEAKSL